MKKVELNMVFGRVKMNRERSTNTKLSIEFRKVSDIVREKEGEVKVKERKIKATRKEEKDIWRKKES